MTDRHDSPLERLHLARMEDPTVDALATMAEAGRRDVLDPEVLTQIISMLVLRVAGARQLLVDLATIAPPTMAIEAEGPPPVARSPHLSALRGSLVHREAGPVAVDGHAPGCHAAGLGPPTTGIFPGCGCPVEEASAPEPDAPGRTVGHFEVEAVRGVGCMAICVNLRHLDPSNVAVDGAAALLTVGSRVRVGRDDDADALPPAIETTPRGTMKQRITCPAAPSQSQ